MQLGHHRGYTNKLFSNFEEFQTIYELKIYKQIFLKLKIKVFPNSLRIEDLQQIILKLKIKEFRIVSESHTTSKTRYKPFRKHRHSSLQNKSDAFREKSTPATACKKHPIDLQNLQKQASCIK